MKTLDTMMVSYYPNVYSKTPTDVSFYSILRDIVKGKYADPINIVRRYYREGDTEAAQQTKLKLPCFTAAGRFDGAHAIRNLIEQSGLILIDMDHVADIPGIRLLCESDPHTASVFQSPTDGLKIGAYVDNLPGRHREAYALVSEYYNRLTKLSCDPACKDECRLCYVSYDPDAYIAALYEPFHLPDAVALPETENACPPKNFSENSPVRIPESPESKATSGTEKEFLMSYIFLNPLIRGQRHSTLFKLACEARKRGYDEKNILTGLLPILAADDFPEKEIISTLSAGYKHVAGSPRPAFPTAVSYPQKAQSSKSSFLPSSDEGCEDEAYWEGEEFRRNTPCFPEEMYKNIPQLLDDCLLQNSSRRENDLLLLACLTAYSAIMPATWGTYNKRRFSPHLYFVCISPAGSGKSTALLAQKLLEKLQEHIFTESEQAQKAYKIRYTEWQKNRTATTKNKENTVAAEEPEEPPFKMLIIPATTSNTRMQMQLRDNGALGGIIIDAEAQTLVAANKLDCGHFEDILCKAFGHEPISSSYKVNGKKPIVIKHPQLAMMLTGTPEQFYRLVESPDNGLLSRLLLYTYREDPVWKEMGNDELMVDDLFDTLSERAFCFYNFCKEHPLLFSFTRSQWNTLNRRFGNLLAEVVAEGNDHLQAIVKRHGFMMMRIAMVLTRLRQFETKDPHAECFCNDLDFNTAYTLVRHCYEHSRLMLTSLPSSSRHTLKDPDNKRNFLEALPVEFTTEEAVRTAENYAISRSTLTRMLNRLTGVKIAKTAHGKYRKLPLEGV